MVMRLLMIAKQYIIQNYILVILVRGEGILGYVVNGRARPLSCSRIISCEVEPSISVVEVMACKVVALKSCI